MVDPSRSRGTLTCLVPFVFTCAAHAQSPWAVGAQGGPSARGSVAACYDRFANAVLLYGGRDANNVASAEFWQWSGGTWSLLNGNALPGGLVDSSFAYDAARNTAVLFDQSSGATWLWNSVGASWSPGPTVPTGSANAWRFGTAMAYDSLRSELLLFGGQGSNGELDDTWVWDGTAWTQRAPAFSPLARSGHAMAYDSDRGRVVLFGGLGIVNGVQVNLNDTWEWDGTTWLPMLPSTQPTARCYHDMAFHEASRRVVLFGGDRDATGLPSLDDTWEWDGQDWREITTTGQPPAARDGHALVYDPNDERVMMFGGYAWPFGVVAPTTWIYFGHPAEVVAFGSGCAGSNGVPSLAAVAGSSPVLGQTLNMAIGNAPSPGPHFGVLSLTALPGPVPLTSLGAAGCSAFITPDLLTAILPAAGAAPWNVSLPGGLSLSGRELFAQGLLLDASANPGGLTVSNAVRIVMGTH